MNNTMEANARFALSEARNAGLKKAWLCDDNTVVAEYNNRVMTWRQDGRLVVQFELGNQLYAVKLP